MSEVACSKWDVLTEKFSIVFEHFSEIPGLADSVKQIDGFLFASDQCSALFYRKPFQNKRSAVGDLDPGRVTGFSDALEGLSSDAAEALAGGVVFECSVDFNLAVSGDSDGYRGGAKVKGLSIEDLVRNLKSGILDSLVSDLNVGPSSADEGESNIQDVVNRLSELGATVIHFKFVVRHMPIINFFGGRSTRLQRAVKAVTAGSLTCAQLDARPFTIMAHFRRGDISVFPLEDGTFVSCWGRPRPPAVGYNPEIITSPEEAIYAVHEFEPYLGLIREATEGYERIEIIIASDGFQRGVDRTVAAAEEIGLTDEDLQWVRDWASLEETRWRSLLKDLGAEKGCSVKFIFGETKDLFRDTINSLIICDVLLYTSGGFAKTLFKYLNGRDGATMLGPLSRSNKSYILKKIRMQVRAWADGAT